MDSEEKSHSKGLGSEPRAWRLKKLKRRQVFIKTGCWKHLIEGTAGGQILGRSS